MKINILSKAILGLILGSAILFPSCAGGEYFEDYLPIENQNQVSARPVRLDMNGVKGFAVLGNDHATKANTKSGDQEVGDTIQEPVNIPAPYSLYSINENNEISLSVFYFEVTNNDEGLQEVLENELEGGYVTQSILGIGLNVNQEEFRSSAPNPISLKQIVGTDIDLQELLNKLVHNIIGGYRQLENDYETANLIIRKLYLRNLFRKEGLHPYRDATGEFMAAFHNLTPEGYLILKDEQGNLRQYAFKEVEFIL